MEQQQIVEEEKLHLEEQQLLAKVQEIAKKRAKLQQQRVVQQGQSQQLPIGEPKHPVEVEKKPNTTTKAASGTEEQTEIDSKPEISKKKEEPVQRNLRSRTRQQSQQGRLSPDMKRL